MRFDIKLLGRLDATLDGVPILPSASKPRQLLALLALNAGHIVSTPTLMTEMWGELQPKAASTSLYTYVSSLRTKLRLALNGCSDCDPKRILVTEQTGYSLRVSLPDTDVG